MRLSHFGFSSADSLSRRCSGVNWSTSHPLIPGGQGTPRRAEGVVPWRRPLRQRWLFPDRRWRSHRPWLLCRCRACCLRKTRWMHATRLRARQGWRQMPGTAGTAGWPTAPAGARTTAPTSRTPRRHAAAGLSPGNHCGRRRRPSGRTAAGRIAGGTGTASRGRCPSSRSVRVGGGGRLRLGLATSRSGTGGQVAAPSAAARARVFRSPSGMSRGRAALVFGQTASRCGPASPARSALAQRSRAW